MNEEKNENKEENKKEINSFKKKLAIGAIVAGATATALTGCGKDTNREKKENKTEYATEESTKTGIGETTTDLEEETEVIEDKEEKDLFELIAEENNNKYPENKINPENLGMIKSSDTVYLIERTNEDGTKSYILDNKMLDELNEGEEFKTDGIGTIYTIVDKEHKTTVFSMGYIDDSIEVLIPNRATAPDKTEYRTNGNEISLGLRKDSDQIDKASLYYELEMKFQEIINRKDQEKEMGEER